jgi:hypothetical protein
MIRLVERILRPARLGGALADEMPPNTRRRHALETTPEFRLQCSDKGSNPPFLGAARAVITRVTPRRPWQRAFSPGKTLLDIRLDAARVEPRGGFFMLGELFRGLLQLLGIDDDDDDERDDRRTRRDGRGRDDGDERGARRRDDRDDDRGWFDFGD